jgi:ribosome-binding protein aMBF1 (putative translation factor)
MITQKREQMTDRLNDAADAVKQAWSDARERGADVLEAAKEKVDDAREKLGSTQDSLADQLEAAATALRRHNNQGPIARMTRNRPLPAVVIAFAAGALMGAVGSMLFNGSHEE